MAAFWGLILASAFIIFWVISSEPAQDPGAVDRPLAAAVFDGGQDGRGAEDRPGAEDARGRDVGPADEVASRSPGPGLDGGAEDSEARAIRPDKARRISRPKPGRRTGPPRAQASGSGWLDLNAIPWAKVYVDGTFLGSTPLQRVKLSAGWHRIKLVFPTRKKSLSRRVLIRASKTTTQVIELGGPP